MDNSKATFFSFIVLLSLIFSLVIPTSALADGDPPPSPDAPEVVPPPEEVTPNEGAVENPPVSDVPTDVAPQSEPSDGSLLGQLPEGTDVVVVNDSGDPVPLASQEAAEIIAIVDPMWCPSSATTVTSDCVNSTTVAGLLSQLTGKNADGVIYFTSTYGTNDATFNGSNANLVGISDNTLTLQGGWNGTTTLGSTIQLSNGSTFTVPISITNWTGNVFVNAITINGVSSANGLTVSTTKNITLDNVDVTSQAGGFYAAQLTTTTGDITVQNGSSFDGSTSGNNTSRGFSATTGNTGTISITGNSGGTTPYTFQQSNGQGGTNYNGATLSAPIVTLTNVIARENDGNGIEISNAYFVSMNSVQAAPDSNGAGNGLSGIRINGLTGANSTTAVISGTSTFTRNGGYGVQLTNNGTLYLRQGTGNSVTCPTTGGSRNGSGCYSVSTQTTNNTTPPTITGPTITGTLGNNNWYTSNVGISWVTSGGTVLPNTCTNATISSDTAGTTQVCKVYSTGGMTSQSVTIKRDATAPNIAFNNINGTAGTNGWYTSNVTVNWNCTDALSGSMGNASQAVNTEGASQSATGTCTDNAGNTVTNQQAGIKIDKTAPTGVALNVTSGTLGANGWYTTSVDLSTSGADALSGVTCTGTQSQTTDTVGTVFSGSCTNGAGLTAAASPLTVKVDTTPPTGVTLDVTGTQGSSGWYTSPVIITTNGSDGTSGVTCTGSQSQGVNTSGVTFNGSCTNGAGVKVDATPVEIKVDQDAPVIAAHGDEVVEATGPSGALVNYTPPAASDSVSGTNSTADCTAAPGSSFGFGSTLVSCTATDEAGNVSTSSFNITVQDTTPPTITQPADITTTAAGSTGANVNYSPPATSDMVDGAGTADCGPASGSLFPIGDTVVTCTASDSHENSSQPVTFVVHVAKANTGGGGTNGQPGSGSGNSGTNSSGQFNVAGAFIPVTGGQATNLNCAGSTTLEKAGFQISFTNFCGGYSTQLTEVTGNGLPAALPKGDKYVGGVNIGLLHDGSLTDTLPKDSSIKISIPVPSGMDGKNLVILFWDASAKGGAGDWVEKSATVVNGKVTLTIDEPGVFVLVEK
jgi:hypothetical protein